MIQWKKTASATLFLAMTAAVPAWADPPAADPVAVPIMAPDEAQDHAAELSFDGQVTFVNLEGGYYAVDGWMLNGDSALFQRYLGQEVTVTGTPFEGASIYMVKALNVSEIQPKGKTAEPPTDGRDIQPVPLPSPEPMPLPTPEVSPPLPKSPLQTLAATRAKPAAVAVNGKDVAFDQKPVVLDGTLMIPLRAVVEAGSGSVQWDGATQTVTVRLPDRTASFVIGNSAAEMNEDGVYYIQRNLIQMAKAPVLSAGRVLVSADAWSNILGFMERTGQDATLDLVVSTPESGQPSAEPADETAAFGSVTGKITQIETGETTRILVESAAMSNGEPGLYWITVSDSTRITVQEEGQERAGSISDLENSQTVEVELAGPTLMSYPAQAAGASIRIMK